MGGRPNLVLSPGPGLWSFVLGHFGPDLGPDLDLTWDLDLDLSLTILGFKFIFKDVCPEHTILGKKMLGAGAAMKL